MIDIIIISIIFIILKKNIIPLGNEKTIDHLLSCIEAQDRLFAKGVKYDEG